MTPQLSPLLFIQYLKRFYYSLLGFVYPLTCAICGKLVEDGNLPVCPTCWNQLEKLPEPICLACHSFLTLKLVCPDCNKNNLVLPVFALGIFDDYYRPLIHQFKYEHSIPLGRALGKKLGEHLKDFKLSDNLDLIIAVPLHKSRRRRRAFNQSDILTHEISKILGRPTHKKLLKRIRKTADQTHLNREQRQVNVKGAFALTNPELVSGKQILLVDDVTTTGATLTECARVLLQAKARSIICSTLAVGAGNADIV